MKKNNYYIVQMDRLLSTHSYVIGVFDKKEKAIKALLNEEENRGGNKYKGVVIECELNGGIIKEHEQYSEAVKKFKEDKLLWTP